VKHEGFLGNNEIRDTNDEIRAPSKEQPAINQDSQSPPLDSDTFDGLRELGGDDPSFLIEMIQQFLQDGPGHVAAIQQAAADVNPDALMKAAHSFKSGCRYMGALSLGDLCFALEQKGRAGETANLNDLLTALDREYSRVRIALEAALAGLTVVPN